MSVRAPFKRLILRAVLRNVSPMVIHIIAVPDSLHLHEFDEAFRAVLGWDNIGFLFHVHGHEFNSFRRATRPRTLCEFQLRPTETFLYTSGAIDLWEWEIRLLDEEPGSSVGDGAPLCLGGRGAAPPQHCGGPTGYRLMLKRQKQGETICTPVHMEAVLGMLAASDPDAPQVVFMSDGGEDVRQVQEYLHPNGEHIIDWFHITMRLTVLQQQTKALQAERPEVGASSSKQIESIKHLLWHGNVDEALDRIESLFMDLDLISKLSAPADKLATGIGEFRTYIRNNRGSIPNFGERYRQGETISTAFVESTINQVVSRRFVKRQQMSWTLKGAHLLLQTRTKVLNNELDDVFRRWYPKFRPQLQTTVSERKAA